MVQRAVREQASFGVTGRPLSYWSTRYVRTLERLRDERAQVINLLESGHVHPDARHILEDLLLDLDHSIDQELTRRLSPNTDSDSKAA